EELRSPGGGCGSRPHRARFRPAVHAARLGSSSSKVANLLGLVAARRLEARHRNDVRQGFDAALKPFPSGAVLDPCDTSKRLPCCSWRSPVVTRAPPAIRA